mmetsp:Transcript_18213/g.50795  ORF Transcript_18213/g.50795 Transcript_18213/m.50795 type:complete len:239 (+) Transcript_18213:543-1259(+)
MCIGRRPSVSQELMSASSPPFPLPSTTSFLTALLLPSATSASSRTQEALLNFCAASSAEVVTSGLPTSSGTAQSARRRTTASLRMRAAASRAEQPSRFLSSRPLPCLSNTSTIASFFCVAAACSGVAPLPSASDGSARASRSIMAARTPVLRAPTAAATKCSGRQPTRFSMPRSAPKFTPRAGARDVRQGPAPGCSSSWRRPSRSTSQPCWKALSTTEISCSPRWRSSTASGEPAGGR